MTLVYGNLIATNIDPIEKKPFFHFMPGSLAYSIATVGCNFRCLHCQNADISQIPRETGKIPGDFVSPNEVVAAAKASGCRSIAYTYSEPTIFFEYAYDVARLAQEAGLKNVFVSNGYIGEEAAEIVNKAKDNKYRICAVGTTVVRTLESSVSTTGYLKPFDGWTNKFIFPPYEFKVPDMMISNFHLPYSTLLMMVAAFTGYDLLFDAYKTAVKEKYRFGTYGDAMLVI